MLPWVVTRTTPVLYASIQAFPCPRPCAIPSLSDYRVFPTHAPEKLESPILYDNDVTQSKRDAEDIMQFSLWVVSPEQPWHLLSALVLITAKF